MAIESLTLDCVYQKLKPRYTPISKYIVLRILNDYPGHVSFIY